MEAKYHAVLPFIEQILLYTLLRVSLKGLSHEIFGPVFWAVGIYLGLNVNRLWFINLNDAPFILDTYL
jgi:hypothetical protein